MLYPGKPKIGIFSFLDFDSDFDDTYALFYAEFFPVVVFIWILGP